MKLTTKYRIVQEGSDLYDVVADVMVSDELIVLLSFTELVEADIRGYEKALEILQEMKDEVYTLEKVDQASIGVPYLALKFGTYGMIGGDTADIRVDYCGYVPKVGRLYDFQILDVDLGLEEAADRWQELTETRSGTYELIPVFDGFPRVEPEEDIESEVLNEG